MKTYEFRIPPKSANPPSWQRCYIPYLSPASAVSDFNTLEEMYQKAFDKHVLNKLVDSLSFNFKRPTNDPLLPKLVSDSLLHPGNIKQFLVAISDEGLELLEAASKDIKKVITTPLNHSRETLFMLSSGYLCIDERHGEHTIVIPRDVKALFSGIIDEDFIEYRKNIRWLARCLETCVTFHGLTPVDIVKEVCNQRDDMNLDVKDVKELSAKIPFELRFAKLLDNEFIAYAFIRDRSSFDIIEQQSGKSYYIPSLSDIENVCGGTYWGTSVYAKQLLETLIDGAPDNNFCRNLLEAITEVEKSFSGGTTLSEAMDILTYYRVSIPVEANGMANLEKSLLKLWCNTRMPSHKGHTPVELEGSKVLPLK